MENIFSKIEELTQNVSLKDHYAALSSRYRHGQDKTLQSSEEYLAYLACRMPATLAACSEVFRRLKEIVPSFSAKSMLDVGSGPATCALAFMEECANVAELHMVERDATFISYAKKFLESYPVSCSWDKTLPQTGSYDIICASYMLSEQEQPEDLVTAFMRLAPSYIVLIDTGTPKGYDTLMIARTMLIENSYTILAPCPHNKPCPIIAPDWCHFSVRLPRTRLHRQIKGAERGYEDEKFCYLIATKAAARDKEYDRILAHPLKRSGHMYLKLCTHQGSLEEQVVSKKTKDRYNLAKKLDWGDRL